jgi:hypothetical protein
VGEVEAGVVACFNIDGFLPGAPFGFVLGGDGSAFLIVFLYLYLHALLTVQYCRYAAEHTPPRLHRALHVRFLNTAITASQIPWRRRCTETAAAAARQSRCLDTAGRADSVGQAAGERLARWAQRRREGRGTGHRGRES